MEAHPKHLLFAFRHASSGSWPPSVVLIDSDKSRVVDSIPDRLLVEYEPDAEPFVASLSEDLGQIGILWLESNQAEWIPIPEERISDSRKAGLAIRYPGHLINQLTTSTDSILIQYAFDINGKGFDTAWIRHARN